MRHLALIASGMILISSYAFTAEQYPRQGKISRKPAFRKSPSIMLHNKSNYDISTEDLVIIPGESKKIHLSENLELELFIYALNKDLTLNFQNPLPKNISFIKSYDYSKSSNTGLKTIEYVEIMYDEKFFTRYECK